MGPVSREEPDAGPPPRRLLDRLRRQAPAGGPGSDRALLEAYATRRDEAAFAELVRRHAGLVQGVARRVLGDAHAAEDVGQAVFLVLARKAGAVSWRESVAGWLHGAAYRLALKARAAGRPLPPAPGSRPPEADPAVVVGDREQQVLLDGEVQRLPAIYRAPLMLCYLEGRSQDEAAGQLGVTVAALKGRLNRGREMLRTRLVKRGCALPLGLTAVVLAGDALAASRWATTALAAAVGKAVVPSAVELLARAAQPAVAVKWWVTVAVVVALAAVTGGALTGDLSMRRLSALFALVSATTGLPGPVRAQGPYAIVDLGTLGGNQSRGIAVNAAGQVAGWSLNANGEQRAFRTTPGGTLSDPAADLGTFAGGIFSDAFDINASGQVVGSARLPGGATQPVHAYRTAPNGRVGDPGTDLGTFGGPASIAFAINASGQVTGYGGIAGSTSIVRAFRTTPTGDLSDPNADLGTLGGAISWGTDINASGQVAGWSQLVPNVFQFRAFRTTATGKVSDPGADLGTLGGNTSYGQSINDAGQVTGLSEVIPGNTATYRAFRTTATGGVSDPGTDLGTLGGLISAGRAINSFGIVVGESDLANGERHAFIYDTRMTDLNTLIPAGTGWVLTRAYGINDAGVITGWGMLNGQERAYRLTPVPEPAGGLGLVGGAVVGAWVVRRRRERCGH